LLLKKSYDLEILMSQELIVSKSNELSGRQHGLKLYNVLHKERKKIKQSLQKSMVREREREEYRSIATQDNHRISLNY
jgi:hypothetical protein